jgi:flagellar motility protein MotE (MotC chaperone)
MSKLNRNWKISAALVVLSFVTASFLVHELGFTLVQSARANSAPAEPAPVVETKEEDSIRLRVRKRLEDGPEQASTAVPVESKVGERDLKTLWDKLQAKQQELDAKAREIASKEAALSEREALVKTQLSRYEATLTSLRAEVDSLRGLKNAKLEDFKKIYSKMESKKAARILDEMDTDLAGLILSSLKENQSAEILGQMDPEKARRITARFLTGRSFSQVTAH